MSKITKRPFSCDKDFDKVNKFLSDTYLLNGIVDNWDNARWSFNRFCIHNQEEKSLIRQWEKGVQIWEIDDVIVGVTHYEEPGDYFIQINPNYKHLEEEMILWAMENCKKLFPKMQSINISTLSDDVNRKKLLKKYNGIKNDFVDDYRILYLEKNYPLPKLQGEYICSNINISDINTCQKISELYTRIWPDSIYIPNGETVASFSNSPSFIEELSFVVVDKNNNYLAFLIVWTDSYNENGHIYPFGINPNYLDSDVPIVLLGTALNTLFNMGYKSVTLSAWYGEKEEEIFKRFGFKKTGLGETYKINLN